MLKALTTQALLSPSTFLLSLPQSGTLLNLRTESTAEFNPTETFTLQNSSVKFFPKHI